MATVAISSDFLTAFAALPRHVQGKVTDFVNKFRNDPTSPGINYEKINDAADKKESVSNDALVIPNKTGFPIAGFLPLINVSLFP